MDTRQSAPDPDEVKAKAAQLEQRLLGGPARWSMVEFAERAGASLKAARDFWRAMGFPNVADESAPFFTDADVAALRRTIDMVRHGHIDTETAVSLTRAMGHVTDRLVLWQTEALVDDAERRLGLSDSEARFDALEVMPEVVALMESQLGYAFRRQMSAMIGRTVADATSRSRESEGVGIAGSASNSPTMLPLERAVGFADLVSFTEITAHLSPTELASFIHRFENIARDVVTSGGGRVVKTVGDEVLYVADSAIAGARIATDLVTAMAADPSVPAIRAGLVWGRVLSRFGDIFGPAVNLSARLTECAEPNQILMDWETARLCEQSEDFVVELLPTEVLQGIGEVRPAALRRA